MIQLKLVVSLFLVLFFQPITLLGQFTLTIELTGLKNNDGQVLLEFNNEKGEKISGFIQTIDDHKCIIVIKNLMAGKYAFRYFHDENKNKVLDLNWIGIPKEGYGFSNNAKGTFGPPSLEKMLFALKANTTFTCKPNYINF